MKLLSLFAVATTGQNSNLEKEPAILMDELLNRYQLYLNEAFSSRKNGERGTKSVMGKLNRQSKKILARFERTNELCGHWPVSEESHADGAIFDAGR